MAVGAKIHLSDGSVKNLNRDDHFGTFYEKQLIDGPIRGVKFYIGTGDNDQSVHPQFYYNEYCENPMVAKVGTVMEDVDMLK